MQTMTLLDAQPYDPAKGRRRKIQILTAVAAILIFVALAWVYRNWPEEHAVDKFFTALQQQQYETAYGIYFNDPGWLQHREKYSQYTYADFYRDWGPGGEWGSLNHTRFTDQRTQKVLAAEALWSRSS